jgi:hypothetical protein
LVKINNTVLQGDILNLSNKYVFWSIISILLGLFIAFISYIPEQTAVKKLGDITERSYQNDQEYVIDLEKIDEVSDLDGINKEKNLEENALQVGIQKLSSPNKLLLIIYTVLLSGLFLYREKQNRNKIALLERRDDELKILKAQQSSTTIYTNLSDELKPFQKIIEADINLDTLEDKINNESKYLILASRIVLEQLISHLYLKYFKEDASLNIMIVALYKKRVLNHNMHNYAHIIKAFGNKAAHPNVRKPEIFNSKDATLVLGSLLQLLKELESNHLLEKPDHA